KNYFPKIKDKTADCRYTIEAFEHIDYMVPVVPGDYKLLQEKYPSAIKGFHLNLINAVVEQTVFSGISARNILLGNSASFTNNHLEAIDWLSDLDLTGRKVIIPLNYGNPKLAKNIEEYAIEKLGKDGV